MLRKSLGSPRPLDLSIDLALPANIPRRHGPSKRPEFTEEEIIAGLREIRANGGVEFRDFVHELEQAAGSDE